MKKIAISNFSLSSILLAHYLLKKFADSEVIFFGDLRKVRDDRENMGKCILYPEGDFKGNVSEEIALKISEIGVPIQWSSIASGNLFYSVVKDGLIADFPRSVKKIYTSSLVFITEKIKIFFALRKKYSLWQDISLYQAACTIFGDNFADFVASPLVRKLFLSELEDVELGAVFPELCDYISRGGLLKNLVANIEVPSIPFKYPTDGWQQLLIKLLAALPEKRVRFIKEHITRYRGNGIIFCGSKEYGPFDKVFFTSSDSLESLQKIFNKDFSEIAERVKVLKENYLSSVYLAFDKKKVSFKGLGLLVPRKEKLPVLFCDYISNIDPVRAPEDLFLVRCVIAGDTDVFQEEDLISFSQDALRKVFRLKEKPLLSRAFRKVLRAPLAGKGTYHLLQAIKEAEQRDGHLVFVNYEQNFSSNHFPEINI